MSFALTKIQPPRLRAGLVERRALEAALGHALATCRLTLLCAPAGFGKTVALTRQRERLPAGTALAWIAADADDDLQRLLECLVAALEPFDLPWRTAPESLVAAVGGAAPVLRDVAGPLLNALAGCDLARGLIVLDDLHRVADRAVYEFLDLLLERLPDHWGLVISSRVEPALALARLRGRGELAEFRQDELRFGADDIVTLVAATAGTSVDVQALLARTGGWAAGLRLSLGPGGAAQAKTMDRHVFDFLAAEVLDQMPTELRDFLLRCSVLPELTATRCAEVSGNPRAAVWLDEIERRGLFVSVLDGPETTLALHDLFRECLDERLRRERPQELPLLLQRAARGEADPLRRIGYLARAGAWDDAEQVLYELGAGLIAAGSVPQVLRLLEHFPPAQRAQSPRLCYVRGLCAWAHWDWLTVRESMARAAAGFEAQGERAAALRARVVDTIEAVADHGQLDRAAVVLHELRGEVLDPATEALFRFAIGWHALANCRLDAVAEPFANMVELLEREPDSVVWLQCAPPTAFLGLPGVRPALQRYVDGALRLSSADSPSALRVLATALKAGLALFAGDEEQALAVLRRADEDCSWFSRPPVQATYLHTVAGLAHAVRGDRDAALAAMGALRDRLDDPRTSGRGATWRGHYLYMHFRVAAILDDDETQRELAAQLAAYRNPTERAVFVRQRGSLPGRLAALDGRWDAAALGLQEALQDEIALDHYGQASELRLRLAEALVRLGRLDDAARALGPALARAAASGELAPLRFAGRRVLRTLCAASWGTRLAIDAQALLREAGVTTPSAGSKAATDGGGDDGLTLREREVLSNIAAGASNKLIARALDLSPHTVKRHVANILGKLGLATRGEAAAWWRAQRTR